MEETSQSRAVLFTVPLGAGRQAFLEIQGGDAQLSLDDCAMVGCVLDGYREIVLSKTAQHAAPAATPEQSPELEELRTQVQQQLEKLRIGEEQHKELQQQLKLQAEQLATLQRTSDKQYNQLQTVKQEKSSLQHRVQTLTAELREARNKAAAAAKATTTVVVKTEDVETRLAKPSKEELDIWREAFCRQLFRHGPRKPALLARDSGLDVANVLLATKDCEFFVFVPDGVALTDAGVSLLESIDKLQDTLSQPST